MTTSGGEAATTKGGRVGSGGGREGVNPTPLAGASILG
jgi:hypothetical protein